MDEVRISVLLNATRAPTLRSSNDARVVFASVGKYERSHTGSNRHHFENSEPRRVESDT